MLLLVHGRHAAGSVGTLPSRMDLLQLVFLSRTEGMIHVVGIVLILDLAGKVFIIGGVYIVFPSHFFMSTTTTTSSFA